VSSVASFFIGAWVGATVSPLLLGLMMILATRGKGGEQ
jgi:hypothetical protein